MAISSTLACGTEHAIVNPKRCDRHGTVATWTFGGSKISRIRLFLQTALAWASIGSAAQAAIISTAPQTLTFGPQKTDFGGIAQPLDYFDSNLGTLESLTVSTSYGFNSSITVTNRAANGSIGTASTESTLILSAQNGSVNSVLQNLLNTAVDPIIYGGYSTITLDLNSTKKANNLAPNTSTVLSSTAATQNSGSTSDSRPADLLAFEVAGGGATNLIANTFTQTNLSNNGGNTTATESTNAQAAFTIYYTYDNSTATTNTNVSQVPEPATLTMLGVGLLGAGTLRRRGK